MDEQRTLDDQKHTKLSRLAIQWLDCRTGIVGLTRKVLDEPIPGGARIAYVCGSGLLFILLLQIVTGICLAVYYVPSADAAHTSVAYIVKQVTAGAFLRSLHSYGSSAMMIVLLLHFLQTFLYGSFKGRRELLWIAGALLSFLVLGMTFTGYLLPWDQKAYFATAVGTNIVGEIPIVGDLMTRMLRGGDMIGTLTISRFYVAHVFLIPGAILLFAVAHIFLFRKAGPAGPAQGDPESLRLAAETFYPRQVLMDMCFALLIIAAIGVLAYFRPATLGPIANPADIAFLPRPEWYYLPLFEWLKLWEGPGVVIGVVVVPGVLAAFFFLLPFLDRSLDRRAWRRPIPVLAVAIVVFGMVYLGAKSKIDDRNDPAVATQIDAQNQQEIAYSNAPFQPNGQAADPVVTVSGATPDAPLLARGRGIFDEHGCSGCHGGEGMGTTAAPSLAGITARIPDSQLVNLIRNPNARMKAGNMPSTDIPSSSMSALVAYLGVIGTSAANIAPTFPVPPALPAAGVGGTTPGASELRELRVSALTARGSETSALSVRTAIGQQLFQTRGCIACHGAAGIGGKLPPMAVLIANIGDSQLIELLKKPGPKMRSGGMPPVEASQSDLSSIVAFLRTLASPSSQKQPMVETAVVRPDAAPNVSEPRPPSTVRASVLLNERPAAVVRGDPAIEPDVQDERGGGRAIFVERGCVACHGSAAQGTQFAPSLIGVARKYPGEQLNNLLHHPTKKMRTGGMPPVVLTDDQMHHLLTYLSSLEHAPTREQAPARPSRLPETQVASLSQEHPASPAPALSVSLTPLTPSGSIQAVHATVASGYLTNPLVERGRRVFKRNSCETCHGEDGLDGTIAAPGLAGTASMLPESALEGLLLHHSLRMQAGGMPATSLKPQDLKSIVAFIRSLNGSVSKSADPR